MPFTNVNGTRLYYTVHGKGGPAVLLIHGAGGSHLHWPSSLRRLPGATVYALDLPGHGRSEGMGHQQIEAYAADTVGFLDAVGVKQAVLVGHSMGGGIAQTIALTAPQRVAGLVLVSTGAKLRVASAILEGLWQDLGGTVKLIAAWAWGPEADPDMVAEGWRAMEATGARVSEIATPTLVLAGSADRMTPPRFGQWLADHIPGASFHLVEGAGHMLMLEKPAAAAAAITTFLHS